MVYSKLIIIILKNLTSIEDTFKIFNWFIGSPVSSETVFDRVYRKCIIAFKNPLPQYLKFTRL